MSQSESRKQKRLIDRELAKVGAEFGNEKTWEITDLQALDQRKRAELAGAITRQFINDHLPELRKALEGKK